MTSTIIIALAIILAQSAIYNFIIGSHLDKIEEKLDKILRKEED